MEPTIRQNDLLVVDVTVREFGEDGVFLIAWRERLCQEAAGI